MSEYYTESPAARFFRDESFILAGGRFQDPKTREWTFTEISFYLNFAPYAHGIQMSIWDSEKREYEMEPTFFEEYVPMQEKLSEINAKYPGKIEVQNLLDKAHIYFEGIGESVYIEDKVTDEEADCEQCGDYNVDAFEFRYFPAVPNSFLEEASLDLHWQFGCYGGLKIHGTFDEKAQEALDTLNHMFSVASDEYQEEIKYAYDTVKKHME